MRRESTLEGWGGHSGSARPEISIVVPVYNAESTLAACLHALIEAPGPSREIIVADDASTDGSVEIARSMGAVVVRHDVNLGCAAGRNLGVRSAQSDIIVFVDSDIVIKPDVLSRTFAFLNEHEDYHAVFGSYCAQPGAKGFLSQYRNLLHHFTHQNGKRDAETYWAGVGAIRKSAFDHVGGFRDVRFIEDIDIGLRLTAAGFRIGLDPALQGTHLKAWPLWLMMKTDFRYRALPWATLMLETGRISNDLNADANGRLGVASAFLLVASLLLAPAWPVFLLVALASLLPLLISMRPLLRFLHAERGLAFAAGSVPAHCVYLLCGGTGFLVALFRHVVKGFPSSPHGRLTNRMRALASVETLLDPEPSAPQAGG